ncbi:hypothetical protein NC651_004504 [Populus alba x Populus x berolinensis]|nr:hypothetical protein NC651_004504 [Populus alba x Populus x berolinensis]
MKWLREVCVHCARVQKDAYYRILPSCKLYRHGFCRCNQQTKQILTQEKSNNEGFKVENVYSKEVDGQDEGGDIQ